MDRGDNGEGIQASIENCAALNPALSRTGGTDISYTNNIANSAMTVDGSTVSGGTDNNPDGADASLPVPQTAFQTILGWDFISTWEMGGPENPLRAICAANCPLFPCSRQLTLG
jgi:hypothetical protein